MIVVEHGPDGPCAFAPGDVVTAWSPDEVAPALDRLDAARARGAWVAGWMAYEAAAAFEPRLASVWRGAGVQRGPLLAFGLCDAPRPVPPTTGATVRLGTPRPVVDRRDYGGAFDRVADWIAGGDAYQVNLTFPLTLEVEGNPLDLWHAVAGAGHGGMVDLGVGPALVSASPELFFTLDAAGRIASRPMKGTAPRASNPAHDAALAAALQASEKARAENLMIVDLLRNDIGRLARIGSVRVPDLWRIESYPTVHQMTSTVAGDLAAPPSLARLMAALFPCGSVTGAPKIRAMEIIRAVEPHPRGAYCGALGWMAPDGRADFSVTIRTMEIADGIGRVGVGGGIVADSTADGEWEEALWKARWLRI